MKFNVGDLVKIDVKKALSNECDGDTEIFLRNLNEKSNSFTVKEVGNPWIRLVGLGICFTEEELSKIEKKDEMKLFIINYGDENEHFAVFKSNMNQKQFFKIQEKLLDALLAVEDFIEEKYDLDEDFDGDEDEMKEEALEKELKKHGYKFESVEVEGVY